ncbi:45 kDa calcium-binding protein [Senna tora]|uniref:45 kDa calcium-binding protein n=1 Tax=Senna tora TaxID=362788 RepID=A0A834TZ57_9FABA|nr:45 kDa calcium-binding protein [Senna tora]
MAKVVVYAVIATAFLFFFVVLAPFLRDDHRKGPGLNRRFGYNIQDRTLSFDPLLAQMQRSNTNNTTSASTRSGVIETYQFLIASGKLNTTLRLTILFPLLDRDPKDYSISFNELEAWIIRQSMDRLDYSTHVALDSKDKNADSSVSFREYFPQFSDTDLAKKGMEHGEAGWWQVRFDAADIDHNGLLNFTELRDFLHPEDSENEATLKWLLRDRFKQMDYDDDGKLNFKEFQDHVYASYVSYVEFETAGKEAPKPHDKFHELDVNHDK